MKWIEVSDDWPVGAFFASLFTAMAVGLACVAVAAIALTVKFVAWLFW